MGCGSVLLFVTHLLAHADLFLDLLRLHCWCATLTKLYYWNKIIPAGRLVDVPICQSWSFLFVSIEVESVCQNRWTASSPAKYGTDMKRYSRHIHRKISTFVSQQLKCHDGINFITKYNFGPTDIWQCICIFSIFTFLKWFFYSTTFGW